MLHKRKVKMSGQVSSSLCDSLEQRRLFSVILSAPGKPHIIDPSAVGANDVTWASALDSDGGVISYTLWYKRIGSHVDAPGGTTTRNSSVLADGLPSDFITPDTPYATWVVAYDPVSQISRPSHVRIFHTGPPLTPATVGKAYGLNTLYKQGLNGAGEIIGLVELGGDPTLANDISGFDAKYHLAAPILDVMNSSGNSSPQPTDTDHAHEISLDVEWAHAIAPDATIVVVEGTDDLTGFLGSIKQAVAAGASVVSMSYAFDQTYFSGNNLGPIENYDSYFQVPGVTFVAAAGDHFGVPEWPSVSSDVISVGGTQLSVHATDPSQAQVDWQNSDLTSSEKGSGTGFGQFGSALDTVQKQTPDVSYAADGYAWYYDGYLSYTGWGTSFGAPQWAALIILADQARSKVSEPKFDSDLEAPQNQELQLALNIAPAGDFGLNSASAQQPASQGNSFESGLGTPTGALINDLIQFRG